MSAAGSPGASLNDLSSGAESPQETVREKLVRQHRASKSPAMAAAGGEAAGDTAPLWVALPTMQSLFDSAIPPSSASSSMSMISWLKFWSEHSRCIPALSALSKTDFITIFLDVKRGAVGADAHELSLSDFCSCLIAVADRLNLISIPSSPGRSAASCAPSAEVLSAMSSFTASLQQSHHTPQHSRAATSGPVSAVVSSPPIASVHSSHDADVAGGSSSALGTAALISGSPDVSSQVLQLLHRFYEFYCSGAARLNHDNYVQCLVELQALQVGNAASGDATQVFFKFAATPDRGMTQEQFVDSIVHLAHVSAPESPLHSSMHALVMLGMGGHFARSQERRNLREVLDSATIGELLKETQSFCAVAFRTCSGGKSILNIAQVNRWLLALKLQPMPSQTDIIHVFRDVLRQQAARGSSSVGLDSLGFQSFLLQLAVLALQGSQVTPTSAGSSFSTLLKHMGWGTSHAPIAAQSSIASPVPAQTIFAVPPAQADGPAASHSDASFSAIHVPSVTRPRSPPIPAGIAVSLFKAAPGNPAASVGNDVLTQLADMEQASAFAELQRIYTDKQVLAVQRKKELQLELEAWTAAELEGAELKYKEQAVFRPTPALQDRERALQVLLSNAIKTHPDELRRQQQIVEAFTSKERQAWRLRCDVYANTVRSRVKMAVDVKKKRLAETLRSMQIQLEVNMKKDFEALSKRFAGKSIFLRSSGPAPPVSDKVMLEHHAPSHQSAATTPRVILTAGAKTSAAARSQSAPRNKQVYSSQLPRDLDSQERQQSQGSGIVRERPQSAIPTMSRRKSVLQEMEEAYLKAASRAEPRKAPLPAEARGRQTFPITPRDSGQRPASALSDASDSRGKSKAALWGASSSNASNGRADLEHLSGDDEAAVVDDAEHDRQQRLRARMQSRSARVKPWASKSPRVFTTPPTSSNRSAMSGDRSQLAADILNEDRVALAARLRDPGDDPPPNYFREPTAADDEPLNVSRHPFGGKQHSRDSSDDTGRVIGVSEPEEWREISTLQTEWLGACIKISRFLISMQS